MRAALASVVEFRAARGFFRGLPRFLSDTRPALAEARRRVGRQIAGRERTFARLLKRAVFNHPASPYRHLLQWAGVTYDDLLGLLATDGLTATLERLYDAGVRVSLEEFKGQQALLRRPGLEIPVRAADFDNPLAVRRYPAETGGSSGAARSVHVDLDLLVYESGYHALFYAGAGLTARPVGIWHLAPPGVVGLKTALIQARLRRPAERWFSQRRLQDASLKHSMFARATVLLAGFYGAHLPTPEYTPAGEAHRVAEWLADARRRGTPAILLTTPSAAVRASGAALDAGLDIAGSFFVLVGEPYTPAKAAVVAAAGCRAASHYAMTEAGLIGLACLSSERTDDVHLLGDKVTSIVRDVRLGTSSARVPALVHTTVLPSPPKIMINVESGDTGVRERRACACGALPGFDDHLHTIRSYEKLTSEGMHVLGGDVLALVEEALPARFGGRPTDYQLVEREEGGLPRVSLVVGSGVGPVDESEAVHAVLAFLRSRGTGQSLMADVWEQGRTLRLARGEPHTTPSGKTPPLLTLRD